MSYLQGCMRFYISKQLSYSTNRFISYQMESLLSRQIAFIKLLWVRVQSDKHFLSICFQLLKILQHGAISRLYFYIILKKMCRYQIYQKTRKDMTEDGGQVKDSKVIETGAITNVVIGYCSKCKRKKKKSNDSLRKQWKQKVGHINSKNLGKVPLKQLINLLLMYLKTH